MVPVVRYVVLLLAATLALTAWITQRETSDGTPISELNQQQLGDSIWPNRPAEEPNAPVANNAEKAKPKPASGQSPTPPTVINTPIASADKVSFADLESGLRRLTSAVANWRFEDYRRHSDKARLDGEAAYQAYLFLKSCVGSETTANGYHDQLAQLQVLYDRNRERVSARQLEARLNSLEQGFERCNGLGENPLETAIDWLQLAADLGYLAAQIGFYQELPELLRQDRWAVFRRPEFLDLYHQRAPDYLHAALASGHPEAFRHYGVAVFEGIVFEADSILALAYYHAADLALDNGQDSIRDSASVTGLSAQQLREARRLGEDLCAQYCR